MNIIQAESEDVQNFAVCKEIAETLLEKYPGWMWAVRYQGGAFIVKNLNLSSIWGFLLKHKDVIHDANVRKRAVIKAGGELLERCHLRRGERREGDMPTVFEGAKNWKR